MNSLARPPAQARRESVEAPDSGGVERETDGDSDGNESVESIGGDGGGAGESEIIEGDPVEREGVE